MIKNLRPILITSNLCECQANSYFLSSLTRNTKGYVKKQLVGFSMEQMFDVVSDIDHYQNFVPYVKKSLVHSKSGNNLKADLIVGFPPLTESYTSHVKLEVPKRVQSICNDGNIFNFLMNDWKFSPGPKDLKQSCVLDFKVKFEFKSILHRNVANIFFDIICNQMESAFLEEASKRYGKPSIKRRILFTERI